MIRRDILPLPVRPPGGRHVGPPIPRDFLPGHPFLPGMDPAMHLHRRGGYQGLDHIFELLQNGVSQHQFDRLQAGRTPGHMGGAFTGLNENGQRLLAALLQSRAPAEEGGDPTYGLAGDPEDLMGVLAPLDIFRRHRNAEGMQHRRRHRRVPPMLPFVPPGYDGPPLR